MNILKINLNDQLKNNYVYLPKDFVESHLYSEFNTKSFENGVIVIKLKKISQDDEIFFLGWMGGISSKEGVIDISSVLGRSLKLHSGEYLKVFNTHSEDFSNNLIESIELVPVSNYDYQMIENNSTFFEENLLNQIMVVYDGLILPFVFFDNKVSFLKVNLEIKNKPVILSQDCEVKVAFVPPIKHETEKKINYFTLKEQKLKFDYNNKNSFENIISLRVNRNFLLEHFNSILENDFENKTFVFFLSLNKNDNINEELIFRLSDKSTISYFYNTLQKYKKSTSKDELNILLNHNFLNKFPYKNNFWINLIVDDCFNHNNILLQEFVKLNTILFDNDKIDLTLFKIDSVNSYNEKLYTEFISNNVKIEYFYHNLNNSHELTNSNDLENSIRKEISNFIENNVNLFLNFDFIYDFNIKFGNSSTNVLIRFNFYNNKTQKDYADILTRLKINLKTEEMKNLSDNNIFIYFNKSHQKIIDQINLSFSNELNIIFNYNINNKNHRHIICNKNLNSSSELESESENFLTKYNKMIIENDITNSEIKIKIKNVFSNKNNTSLSIISFPKEYNTKLFMSNLYQSELYKKCINVYINLNLFNFNDYNDIKIFEKYLKNLLKFYTNLNNSKTIFIIEGLERFKKIDTNPMMTNSLTNEINNTFSYILTKFINKCNKINTKSNKGNLFYICLIISGFNFEEIALDFLSKNISFDSLKINYIEKSIVKEILRKIISEKIRTEIIEEKYLEECLEFCRNFVLADFIKIYKGDCQNKSEFLKVLSKYIPIGISDEKIIKLGNDFSNIGGMNKIKEEIYDTIVLSIKSSEMFKGKLPIKMSSGILLTGPPGCGKTLIASALQKEFKINFYSVKGPELLNKYIGASEAAIREVFENAKKTVPCVVFFDEFDSLAPKRGSGSSGVTDRIVNQLLTYLDGIESREGIFVIGASSRPDLIDPAILRPGRLDKIILCDFPDKKEREDILSLYYNTAHNQENIINDEKITNAIQHIADKTNYFTGADLQSLIYNSFLSAVKRNIQNNLDSHAIITDEDLYSSFKNFKSSISDKEKNFHDEIKKTFANRIRQGESIDFENNSEKMKKLNENDLKMTLY